MTIHAFLNRLSNTPDAITFEETMEVIDQHYSFSPCKFSNGDIVNTENQNNGSCKIFAFAQLNKLSETLTLQCFGDYYRIDVLQNPDANDHGNIRNFMNTGWTGIEFKGTALTLK